MSKLFTKSESLIDKGAKGRFEKFFLTENPFPSNPYVNRDSTEKKFNGSIYEDSIRYDEYNRFKNNFLTIPQSDPNHLRLGFLIDSSYIGRGNGKTAFIINLLRRINDNYALDLSNNLNKCFAIYFAPEGGGKTKSFEKFVDLFFDALLSSGIINTCLAILRYEVVSKERDVSKFFNSEEDLINKLNDEEFVRELGDKQEITKGIFENEYMKSLSKDFPLYDNFRYSLKPLVTQNTFFEFYNLKKEREKYEFVFSDLVSLFLASGFVGSYIFVDDFERIPEFQSSIQRKDFSTQLRTILFDGSYLNSKIGFYNFIFALHAGVPRLIQEAWELAGLEQRVPINSNFIPRHNIMFEKINEDHAKSLIKRYLNEFRIKDKFTGSDLYPFEKDVIDQIARDSELNASKILQFANNLIEYAVEKDLKVIDQKALEAFKSNTTEIESAKDKSKDISNTTTIDLISKSKKSDD